MQRFLPIIIILVLLAALAGIGVWYARTNPQVLDQALVELGLKTTEVQGIGGSGFIEAVEVDIASELGGQIAAIRADEGDRVHAGDTLIELDGDTLKAQIRQAQAAVESAEAQLARVKAGARPEEIRQAEAAVAQAEAARDGARQAWQDALAARDNPQQLDMQISAAETALAVARDQLRQTEANLQATEEQKKQADNVWNAVAGGIDIEIPMPDGSTETQHVDVPDEQWRLVRTQHGLATATWWQAWTGINMAQAQVDGAQTHLANLQAMRDNPLELDAQVDAARTQYDVAQAAVDAAQAQLALAKAGAPDSQVRLAEAGVRQAEAKLHTLQVQLDKLTLRSPIDGTVIEKVAHAGETASPGARLLQLGKLKPVTLTIYVPETDLGHLRIGQPAEARVDAFPDKAFQGEIILIASEAEFTPKNVQTKEERASLVFAVKIRLPNEEGLLRPGMPADAVIRETGD